MNVPARCLDENGHHVRPEDFQPIAHLHIDNYIVADKQFMLNLIETV